MSTREDILDQLNDVHTFPGNYLFKVIGNNTDEFVSRAAQACIIVLGPDAKFEMTTRESSGGKHLAITLDAVVPDAETVLLIYDLLGELDGVKFML